MKAADRASRSPGCRPARCSLPPFRPRGTLFFLLLAAAISAGCVWSVPQPKLAREPRPQTVPLRVGVYYSPKLRWFIYWHHPTDTAWVLGKPSVRLLNEAFTLLFRDVVDVPRPGSESSDRDARDDLAGIIEPRIVSAAYDCCAGGVRAHVTYGFILYSPRGEPVASWSATGSGRSEGSNPFLAISYVRQSFERAMREATWKLTSEFRGIPEIRQWLTEQGVREDRVPPPIK